MNIFTEQEQIKQIAKTCVEHASSIIQNISPIDILQGLYFVVSDVTEESCASI